MFVAARQVASEHNVIEFRRLRVSYAFRSVVSDGMILNRLLQQYLQGTIIGFQGSRQGQFASAVGAKKSFFGHVANSLHRSGLVVAISGGGA